MLNEEKIRLMTRAAAYESHEGKKTIPINEYFKGDYITLNLIWSWISYTLAYVLCVGLWAVYKLDYLMENFHKMDLVALGKRFGMIYAIGLVVYLILCLIYYSWKYRQNRKSLAGYYQLLKRILAIYEKEGKASGSTHTAGGTRSYDDITGI